jgi:hypothetical protein
MLIPDCCPDIDWLRVLSYLSEASYLFCSLHQTVIVALAFAFDHGLVQPAS